MNGFVQAKDGRFSQTILGKNRGARCKAAQQRAEEKHRQGNAEHRRDNHGLEQIVETVLQPIQQILVSGMR